MRLPNNVRFGPFPRVIGAVGLSFALASCASPAPDMTRMASYAQTVNAAGPAADYPVVLGDPFTVDGQLYTPEDTLNYDEVGYAGFDPQGGGVTVSHRTLPLPSYVEITSLDSGKTILARVERRGPMTGSRLVALSQGAATQLGISEGGAVRVRRVNPPEIERAELRAGKQVAERLQTPMSLAEVLRDRLPERGSASLRSAEAPPVPSGVANAQAVPKVAVAAPTQPESSPPANEPVRVASAPAAESPPQPASRPVSQPRSSNRFQQAFGGERQHSTAYPLRPLASVATPVTRQAAQPAPRPVVIARVEAAPNVRTQATRPAPAVQSARATAPAPTPTGKFVVQAAAFSSQTNAARAADIIDGFVTRSGKFYRVRTGPFPTRGQAEAALAKVRAAGYSDARVFTNAG